MVDLAQQHLLGAMTQLDKTVVCCDFQCKSKLSMYYLASASGEEDVGQTMSKRLVPWTSNWDDMLETSWTSNHFVQMVQWVHVYH